MELRSGRRLRSLPTPPPRPSRRPPGFPDGDGSDRISALPDEMLLEILVRLRCARAAAHTSGLSRRWRGLWKQLLELSFRDMSADAADAALFFLEVDIPDEHLGAALVSALLLAAARLEPADLVFSLWGNCKDGNFPFEIPCFERATSVKLDMVGLYLLPPAGAVEFPLLEKLSVVCCSVDTAELVRRCPRLRVFRIEVYPSEDVAAANRIKVHSPTIEDLAVVVKAVGVQLDSLDIMAPVLKRFSLRVNVAEDFTVSFSAPMVENIMWDCLCDQQNVGFGEKWRLHNLKLVMKEDVGVLRMHIFSEGELLPDRTFSQEIAQLPAFSVLKLHLQSKNHGIGALVSHLL
ncbi:putative FBD-associated F-box protein At5g56560 [Lolium perenne]|uniref:putative FBD-associated F-box protein At5g56560 n=1 Tax=Lolium perenne TaxID=4522 RepID=UPI0021F5628A|nr:putative FBD-associated F-box protein At5g56560 [Lolium perenne]